MYRVVHSERYNRYYVQERVWLFFVPVWEEVSCGYVTKEEAFELIEFLKIKIKPEILTVVER